MATTKRYSGEDIQVLEGLEPVRKRPGMYIGGVDTRGYHHLLWEIVDNSVDEVINGYAKKITVTLDKDQKGVEVKDDGRGIPAGGFSCWASTGTDIKASRHRTVIPHTFISTSFSFHVTLLDGSGLNYAQLPHRLLHDHRNVKGSFGHGFAVLIPARESVSCRPDYPGRD